MLASSFVMPRFGIKSCNVGNHARRVAPNVVMLVRKRATSPVENACFWSVMWYFHVDISCHQSSAGSRKILAFRKQSAELRLYERCQTADIKRKCCAETMKRKFSVQAHAVGLYNAGTLHVQIPVTPAK